MRLRRIPQFVAAVGGATFAVSAWCQSASLDQVIEKTVLSNPEIQARAQDFRSALEGQNVAHGALLPQITAQGWTGKEYRGSNSSTPSTDWNRTGYSLELRQLLFDGFSTINGVRQLGFEKLAGYYTLMASVDSLATEALNAYLDVQRYREMDVLAHENFKMHETVLSQLRERQDSGVGRGVDLEQAYGRLALAQTNLMTEANNLNDVTQRYRRVVGEYPAETLLEAPDVSAKLPSNPTDFRDSLRSNPTILAKQALVQAAQAGVSAAKGRHAPTLELRAGTGRDRELPGEEFRNIQSTNVQLVLSYNLYRGGADAARVRQTAAQSYAARDVRDYTCRNVQQDLSVAWNNIMRLRAQIPYLRQHEEATAKVRIAYGQQFQIGQRTLLDLLDTENELFDARRALVNGLYDLKKAEYQWLALSNRVLPTVGLSQPYTNDRPEEAAKLEFSDESLQACLTPAPDTRNLAPIAVQYHDGMLPPTITSGSRPAPGAKAYQ